MNRYHLFLVCLLCCSAVNAYGLRVATAQFDSIDGDFTTNLAVATKYILSAQEQHAQIVLLPEFALIGYNLSPEIWESAEFSGGRTEQALSVLAVQTSMYIGTSFLEVDGENFYNTFILIDPAGKVAGQVRKQVPAGAEGYFFKGQANPHVINTAIGRIGIGICQETYRCFLPAQLYVGNADLVLMPFSYPDLSASGGLGSPKGSYIAGWYADQLGIPIVTSNKTGSWPQVDSAFFPGQSAAVSGDGELLGELGSEPAVLVVEVHLEESSKRQPTAECIGPFLQDLTLGSWLEKRMTWTAIGISQWFESNPDEDIQAVYTSSPKRRAAALKLQRALHQ